MNYDDALKPIFDTAYQQLNAVMATRWKASGYKITMCYGGDYSLNLMIMLESKDDKLCEQCEELLYKECNEVPRLLYHVSRNYYKRFTNMEGYGLQGLLLLMVFFMGYH